MKRIGFLLLLVLFGVGTFLRGQEKYVTYEDKKHENCLKSKAEYIIYLERDSLNKKLLIYKSVYIETEKVYKNGTFICINDCKDLSLFHKLKDNRQIVRHGKHTGWYKNGMKRYEGYYINGLWDKSHKYRSWSEEGEEIFFIVDIMPEFPGGEQGLIKFFRDNVSYPKKAVEKNIEEKIYVKFMINKKGKVKNISIARGKNQLLIEAAINVVEKMPKWKPGTKKGEKVNVWYTIPINYQL